jgi:hypothetical protein
MIKKFTTVAASMALIAAIAPSFAADLTPQGVSQLNVKTLADGYRTSKLVGAPVVNDANQSVGTIDDLLVGRSDKVLYAVLSVGGFLGMGSKLIAVPWASLQIRAKDVLLPGASKDQLKALPEFKYATS